MGRSGTLHGSMPWKPRDEEFCHDSRDGRQHNEVDEAEHDVFTPRQGERPTMHLFILHSRDRTAAGNTARPGLTKSSGKGAPRRERLGVPLQVQIWGQRRPPRPLECGTSGQRFPERRHGRESSSIPMPLAGRAGGGVQSQHGRSSGASRASGDGLAFGDAVAPFQGEPGDDGAQVVLESSGEAGQLRDATVGRLRHPNRVIILLTPMGSLAGLARSL